MGTVETIRKTTRILHIFWVGTSGGAEIFVRDLCEFSDTGAIDNSVCFLSKGGRMAEKIGLEGIRLYYLGMKHDRSIFSALRLVKVLNAERPDIVIFHVPSYSASFIICFYPGIKKVRFEHGAFIANERPVWLNIFYRLFGNLYDLIITNTEYSRSVLISAAGLRPDKVVVHRMGIDFLRYSVPRDAAAIEKLKVALGIPQGYQVIGTVGRLVRQKAMDDFIRAASAIASGRERCVFVIAGDGPERRRLEQLASSLGIKISFLGDRSDVPELLNIFDLFLVTSRCEPLGLAMMEAMAAAVPVVSFPLSGPREIIDMIGGGVVVEDRDCNALALAAIGILENRQLYEKLSREGREGVRERFDIRKNIKDLESIYASLVRPA